MATDGLSSAPELVEINMQNIQQPHKPAMTPFICKSTLGQAALLLQHQLCKYHIQRQLLRAGCKTQYQGDQQGMLGRV